MSGRTGARCGYRRRGHGELDDWLARARAGDPHAWGGLYARLEPALRAATAPFRGIDREAAIHDVLLTCVERDFPGYRGGSLIAYLVRSVRNRCIDEVRSHRFRAIALDDAPELAERTAIGPEERVLREVLIAWALARACIERRDEWLLCRNAEGYSHIELARMTRMTPGQVAVRLHRARARLARVRVSEAGMNPAADHRPDAFVHDDLRTYCRSPG